MSLLDSTFMESYRQNVMITGSDSDLESMFEGATPISYEDAISSIYEIQYSVEAMALMNENALMMESAGVAVLNEGVIGNFLSAAVDKIKELAQKVKDFVVACIKKVQEFFRELYAKATPIDKVMQQYGKKPIDPADITVAISNGLKIPGSLWLVNSVEDDANAIAAATFDQEVGISEIKNTVKVMAANVKYTFSSEDSKGESIFKGAIEKLKDQLKDQKEKDKENFTWVGQLLSDNDTYTKKEHSKKYMERAGEGGDKTKDVKSISPEKWKATAEIALHGQAKMRKYENDIRKAAKDDVAFIEEQAKNISNIMSDKVKATATSGSAETISKSKANYNQYASILVQVGTYYANRRIMILQKCVLPCMRKQHKAAITTYIWITSHVRSAKRKEDKKLK